MQGQAYRAKEIVSVLRAQGLRVTPQRCALYANLLGRTDHPTAEQILEDLNRELPISSKATVYSALQSLRDVGLVREVLLPGGVARFDANMGPHHHFHCRQCGVIRDLPWDTFQIQGLDQLPPQFKAEAHEVTVSGLCDRCTHGQS